MVNSSVFQIVSYAVLFVIRFFVIPLCLVLFLVWCEKVIDVLGQQGT